MQLQPFQPHHSPYVTFAATLALSSVIQDHLAGIQLEHLERGLDDLRNDELLYLLCTGIKRVQGIQTHSRLPITINILQTLKSQLRQDSSFSALEKRLPWAAFTLALDGFMRASEFATDLAACPPDW